MNKLLPIVATMAAFAAGFGAARLPAPAQAALPPITPQYLDLNTYPIERGKPPLVAEDNATVIVQGGPVPKHYHANTDEIQYVIEGTGTEWLGDKQVDLKPGIMLIIPKGTTYWPEPRWSTGIQDRNGMDNLVHMALNIGGSVDAKVQIKNIQVWQANTDSNLTN